MWQAFDFETCLIRPGLQLPPPVCLSLAADVEAPTLHLAQHFPRTLDGHLVGLNTAFDLGVALAWLDCAEPLFAALREDRILDIAILERIAEIGKLTPRKELSLARLYSAHGFGELEKPAVRTDYGRYYGRPLSDYPDEHVKYAKKDASATLQIFERQCTKWVHTKKVFLEDVAFLTRKQFWLGLSRAWGLRTDPARTEELHREALAHVERLRAFAQEQGFIRADGSRDMKAIRAAVTAAYDGKPPMTEAPKGTKGADRKKPFVPNVKTSADVLKESGDPLLEQFAEYGEWSSIENKDIPILLSGAEMPIHTKYGIADTTRTTSAKPNIQNFARAAGVRECFVPRRGYVYVFADYGGLENCTLAQVCANLGIGKRMAAKLNAGVDMHCDVGAVLAHTTYEDMLAAMHDPARKKWAKEFRQRAKGVNFGRPGGMAKATLIQYTKAGYGVTMTDAEAQAALDAWNEKNPDGVAYLQFIRAYRRGDRYDVPIPGTTIMRRGATYCAAANTGFQGLGAVISAEAGWQLAEEMYLPTGRLQDSRGCAFIHDEFGIEAPEHRASEAADILVEVMLRAARKFLTDVQITAEVTLMSRWSKAAESRKVEGKWTIWKG